MKKRDKSLSVFIDRFKVPEKLRGYIPEMLSDEEIIVLSYLAGREGTLSDITASFPSMKTEVIKTLFSKGYILSQTKKSQDYYRSSTFDQILKRYVNHDPGYAQLTEKTKNLFRECVEELYLKRMRESQKPVYRVIPVEEVIRDRRQLIPYYQAVHFLRKASVLSVVDCICRTTFNRCSRPRRVCLALRDQAKFFIERGIGKEINTEGGLEILRLSEESGLVHSIDNRENPQFLCNCCECCCVFVQGLKRHGIFTSIGKSGFVASLDSEKCNQCGFCVDKCIFGAISSEDDHILIERTRCFGCGLCAHECPQAAIGLILDK
ncbi:MAG: 4Fe-4S binding protein [Candidatus Aminicenantales bacterium]